MPFPGDTPWTVVWQGDVHAVGLLDESVDLRAGVTRPAAGVSSSTRKYFVSSQRNRKVGRKGEGTDRMMLAHCAEGWLLSWSESRWR